MVRFLELRKRSMRNHNVRKLYDLNNMFQAFCVPVSVPMEFLPVPIAAQVWVQRYVRLQSYQSQFLWIPPSSYGCPGGGAKVCSPSKLPVSVPMDSSQFLWLPWWGCKGMFALKVTSLSSYGFLPVPMAALLKGAKVC